jgi:TatD DNase family protein
MIDTHCHLTDPRLRSQLDAVLARAAAAGVRMITVSTELADARRCIELCRAQPEIRCTVGVHPHKAGEAELGELAELRELQADPSVVALGEMGLDYHYDFSPRARQIDVFQTQLALAAELERPVVIHCREAVDDTLAVLREQPEVPAVFHCFTGTADEANRVLEAGYMLGFTGVVTFRKSDELREAVRRTPPDRLLVETDAPYLSPEPFRRQKVNEPALVVHTAAEVARLKGLSVEELDRITTANAHRFFRI